MSHLEAHDLNAAVFYRNVETAGQVIKLYALAKGQVTEECGYGFKILKARREVYFYYR
jgi:hypothetical protein